MNDKIDKGRSILNASDDEVNPYGLVLSEKEREFLYGALNTLDHRTNSLLDGRTGWRPEMWATFHTVLEFAGVGVAVFILRHFLDVKFSVSSTVFLGVFFVILQKLNLLLTHERIDDIFARRTREDDDEAKRRARYFKDMGTKDMTLEE